MTVCNSKENVKVPRHTSQLEAAQATQTLIAEISEDAVLGLSGVTAWLLAWHFFAIRPAARTSRKPFCR
jgi:hypothetical protein